ncbi:MAG: acyl-CoA/acyl-ACP dehydrogenase [Alphaproteobacteria bacterium]|nr:acyl-CoA/acyl-ACP dehydrogenase [Alphaproteobacteria bacterium]
MQDSSDSIVVETTRRIFADLCDPRTVNAAKDDAWKARLWQALEESGLTLAWVPEDNGGTGATMTDAFDIARISGQYAVPVALGETLLAGWLLAKAGQQCQPGPMTVAPMRDGPAIRIDADGRLSGRAKAVAFARGATQIVVIADRAGIPVIAGVSPQDCTLADRPTDLGGERADVTFDNAPSRFVADAPAGFDAPALRQLGAALRAAQMTGALETMLHISTEYAGERVAFGRTISKFQAVQHNLAQLGAEVAAALTASGSAADTYENEADDAAALFLEVASAKIRIGEAVEKGGAIAHQVHGAIGYTAEHVLQRFTRRAWGWRDDFGSESVWARDLGERVIANGADALWPTLTSR